MNVHTVAHSGLPVAVAVVCALQVPSAIAEDSRPRLPAPAAQRLFEVSTDLIATNDPAAAVAKLTELVDKFPDDALADDALFLAGQLLEEKLSDPVRAHQAYQRLLDKYPDSRTAIAAERRSRHLATSVNSGQAVPLAEFMELMRVYHERGEAWGVHRAGELLEDYPNWVERSRLHLWLGRVHIRAGRSDAAVRHYLAARVSPNSQARFEAVLGAALAHARLGNFETAERLLDESETEDLPPRLRALEDTVAQVERAQARERLFVIALVAITFCFVTYLLLLRLTAGSWAGAARALARAPTEAIYLIPVAAVLVLAALTGHRDIGPAVAVIAAGGVVVTWLSGSGLEVGATRKRRALHVGLAVLSITALTYVALHRNHLIDTIIETVRFGPDT